MQLRHETAIRLRPEPGIGDRLPEIARQELAVAERYGIVVWGLEDIIEERKYRASEVSPKRQRMMPGRHKKSQHCGNAKYHQPASGPLPCSCDERDQRQSGNENDCRIFQPECNAEPQSRPCPIRRLPSAFGDFENAQERCQDEDRINKVIRRHSEQRYEPGPRDAHQYSHGREDQAFHAPKRTQYMRGNRENQRGIDAVHDPHDECDNAWKAVQP